MQLCIEKVPKNLKKSVFSFLLKMMVSLWIPKMMILKTKKFKS